MNAREFAEKAVQIAESNPEATIHICLPEHDPVPVNDVILDEGSVDDVKDAGIVLIMPDYEFLHLN